MQVEKFLELVKQMRSKSEKRKFEQSVEMTLMIRGIDTKKPEGRISGEAMLPHQPGRPAKVALFADGELARVGRDSGVDTVLSRDDIGRLGDEKRELRKLAEEHDFILAQADMMVAIGKSLGKVLGPRDKMPRPIPPTANLKPLVERMRKTVRFRARDQQAISVRIGTEGMSDEQLAENARSVFEAVKQKVEEKKGEIKKVTLKTTMGKPVKMGVEE
ncbi:MAG: 50S ribosomal protein L1 [Candidatus Hadarchaeales archaeon]